MSNVRCSAGIPPARCGRDGRTRNPRVVLGQWFVVLIAFGLAAALSAGCGDTGSKLPVAQKSIGDAPPPPAAAPAPAPIEPQRRKAEAKHKDYGGGIILTPAASLFTIRERIIFEVQIPEAMKLFKAANNDQGPKTHEEFMEKIIKANQIHLPELLAGERYIYDPKTEQLMVESPAGVRDR
jgi:hypothetical protein